MQSEGGANILESSSHVRVMKERRRREIRRFYFFLEGKVLRNGCRGAKKIHLEIFHVVSSIESKTIVQRKRNWT